MADYSGCAKSEDEPAASLLGLPPEVRVKVFRNLFVSVLPVRVHWVMKPWVLKRRKIRPSFRHRRSAQLLRVCRKLYQDGTPILYSENTYFYNFDAPCYTLQLLSLSCIQMIKHLSFARTTFQDPGIVPLHVSLETLRVCQFSMESTAGIHCGYYFRRRNRDEVLDAIR